MAAVTDLPGRVVCTDRGQHAEARITSIAVEDAPEMPGGRRIALTMTPDWDAIAGGGTARWSTYRFRCRRCRRDAQLREDTLLAAAADALHQAGGDRERITIDISVLPCLAAFRAPVGH